MVRVYTVYTADDDNEVLYFNKEKTAERTGGTCDPKSHRHLREKNALVFFRRRGGGGRGEEEGGEAEEEAEQGPAQRPAGRTHMLALLILFLHITVIKSS